MCEAVCSLPLRRRLPFSRLSYATLAVADVLSMGRPVQRPVRVEGGPDHEARENASPGHRHDLDRDLQSR